MDQLQQVEGDLRFVRSALAASDRPHTPAPIYFLWAAAVLVGFVLVDARPPLVGLYWMIVGPAGFAISALLGWRYARRTGQACVKDGRRHLLHWGGMLVVIALTLLMPARGILPWEGLSALILLILAFAYFTAGVHGERPLLWVGALMGAGYILVTLVSAYAWTTAGVAIALALAIAGLREGRTREAAA